MKHSLVFHLIRLGKKIQKRIDFTIPPPPLSYSQAAAILAIFLEQGMNQSEIAARLHLEPASVVTLVDELERVKLVKRVTQNSDRRKYLIELTQRGEVKAKSIKQTVANLDKQIRSALNTKQEETFANAIERITLYLENMKGGEHEISSSKRPMAP